MYKSSLTFLLLTALGAFGAATPGPYPIKVGANNRYLVDTNGRPWLMIGDSPHSLAVNLNDSDTGSPFPNTVTTNLSTPGNNSAGDTDWVLVLEASPSGGTTLPANWTGGMATLRIGGSATVKIGP